MTTLVTDVREKPERIYAPLQFEARDEMPDEYRAMVLRLLRETNEIGSVKVCYEQMRDMTKNVSLAPDPVSRVRIVEFFADEMRHQKIFDGVVRAMGEIPGEDFVSSIDGLNATSSVREWVDLALLNHFIDRVGAFQLLDYELSSFAPLSRVQDYGLYAGQARIHDSQRLARVDSQILRNQVRRTAVAGGHDDSSGTLGRL